MALMLKQAKRLIGSFCSKVTQNGDIYRVYFKIPAENKNTIQRLLSVADEAETDEEIVTGYVEVASDPSRLFDKKLEVIKGEKKKEVAKAPVKKEEKKVEVKKVEVKKEVKKEEKKEEPPKLTPSKVISESKLPTKKVSTTKTTRDTEKPKPRKRGFFGWGRGK